MIDLLLKGETIEWNNLKCIIVKPWTRRIILLLIVNFVGGGEVKVKNK